MERLEYAQKLGYGIAADYTGHAMYQYSLLVGCPPACMITYIRNKLTANTGRQPTLWTSCYQDQSLQLQVMKHPELISASEVAPVGLTVMKPLNPWPISDVGDCFVAMIRYYKTCMEANLPAVDLISFQSW